MCIRFAYQCRNCHVVFQIPKERILWDSPWWMTLCIRVLGSRYNRRLKLKEVLCDNKFCLRRDDAGYIKCMAKKDTCVYCIRFGDYLDCYTRHLYVQCQSCFNNRTDIDRSVHSYPVPWHFRHITQAANK